MTEATRLLLPWLGSVTLKVKVPLLATRVVPRTTPLSVKVAVSPATMAPLLEVTDPVTVWLALALDSAGLVIVTTGGAMLSITSVPPLPSDEVAKLSVAESSWYTTDRLIVSPPTVSVSVWLE